MELRLILFAIYTLTLSISSAKNYWKHAQKQGVSGACHAFSTLGLIEAEYFIATGKYIDLSERDLFTRHLIGNSGSAEVMLYQQLDAATRRSLPTHYHEGSTLDLDFELVKRHGVALESRLKYNPIFSAGTVITLRNIRENRRLASIEAATLRKSNNLTNATRQQLIKKYIGLLRRQKVIKFLTITSGFPARQTTRNFVAGYNLITIPLNNPKTTLALIRKEIATHPVAVDVYNYNSLLPASAANPQGHTYHCVIIHSYDPATATFTVRNSNALGPDSRVTETVSARGLAKIARNLYYLKKK